MATPESERLILNDMPGFDEEAHNREMIEKARSLEAATGDPSEPLLPSEADLEPEEEEEYEGEAEDESEDDDESEYEDEDESEYEDEDDTDIEEELEAGGLDIDALRAEFEETGELSEDAYEALENAGIPRETVDIYLDGISAQVELLQMKAYDIVGGEKQYQNLMNWASDNLSQDEIDTFNEVVGGNNFGQFKLAVQGLKARFDSAYGSGEDNLGGKPTSKADVYESTAQLMEDMRDPRYKTDTAFQKKVVQKLRRSNLY